MATRGHYIIDKTVIYNHWDNYPEGAAILLNRMLLQEGGDWAGRFVRANTSAEITNGEFYGGAEFNYYIDSKNAKIRVMSVFWDDENDKETEKLFFEGSIYDFINECFPNSAEVGRLPKYKQSTFIKMNTWKDGECIESLKNKLQKEVANWAEYCTFAADKPNKKTDYIQKIIDKMQHFFD